MTCSRVRQSSMTYAAAVASGALAVGAAAGSAFVAVTHDE
jgi:hypothetical protein